MPKQSFSFRAFTAFLLLWAFVVLLVSGLVLYVAPPGRIANWTDWRLLGLTKGQWESVHTILSLAFVIGAFFHILKFNWKVLLNYLKKKAVSGLRYRRELVTSAVLSVLFLAGSAAEIPPFVQIMDFGEYLKNSWASPEEEPPIPHLELQTLAKVARSLSLTPNQALNILQRKGVSVQDTSQTLREIAEEAGTSAREVYTLLREVRDRSTGEEGFGPGSGLGRLTLSQVAERLSVPVDTVLARLARHGVEAQADLTIRDVAQQADKRPYEVMKWMEGE